MQKSQRPSGRSNKVLRKVLMASIQCSQIGKGLCMKPTPELGLPGVVFPVEIGSMVQQLIWFRTESE